MNSKTSNITEISPFKAVFGQNSNLFEMELSNRQFQTASEKIKMLKVGWPSDRIGSIIFETDPKTDGFRIGFRKIGSDPTDSKILVESPTEVRLHYLINFCIIYLIYALFS